jgi:Ala-tRNA(Pro) deacylase
MKTFEKIKKILDKANLEYSVKHHEPVYTSGQAAEARGDKLKQGAKAIIMKANRDFVLIVISAEKKIDSKKLKKILKSRDLSFAGSDKLRELGLESGSVPPFGSVLGLRTYVDKSLLENEEISFNAGSLTDSITMKSKDYLKTEKPIVEDFS